eukprot:4270607-Pyramimonas_sp.AAC.1
MGLWRRMGDRLHLCETRGQGPSLLTRAHIFPLTKPSGGYHPISPLPPLYRLWGKARFNWFDLGPSH